MNKTISKKPIPPDILEKIERFIAEVGWGEARISVHGHKVTLLTIQETHKPRDITCHIKGDTLKQVE